MTDCYDIKAIIDYCLHTGIDISPSDRKEWKMFCCALKVLGYNEDTFVTLSSCKEADSHKAWREERSPKRYKDEDGAKGMIVKLARMAGIDVEQFRIGKSVPQWNTKITHSSPHPTTPKPEQTTMPPIYITEAQLNAAHKHYKETSLYIFLCRHFIVSRVDKAFELYKVGASRYKNEQGGSAVAYPYINVNGQCVDCEITHVSPTTGSRKDAPPLSEWIDKETGEPAKKIITWALAEMKQKTRRAPWCSFGDHLLPSHPDNDVCIVESAKSALILHIAYSREHPEWTWIAIRNKQSLTLENIKLYKGRKINIFPDRDGITEWRAKAQQFANAGYTISIDTTLERYPGEKNDDLADIIIRYRQGTQQPPSEQSKTSQMSPRQLEQRKVWEAMKASHPALGLETMEKMLMLEFAL